MWESFRVLRTNFPTRPISVRARTLVLNGWGWIWTVGKRVERLGSSSERLGMDLNGWETSRTVGKQFWTVGDGFERLGNELSGWEAVLNGRGWIWTVYVLKKSNCRVQNWCRKLVTISESKYTSRMQALHTVWLRFSLNSTLFQTYRAFLCSKLTRKSFDQKWPNTTTTRNDFLNFRLRHGTFRCNILKNKDVSKFRIFGGRTL